mmetsp:Transcript_40867/g.66256  ORF Transcript_40867/g.66256 Transcript_40867/m.66256 type:complete len:115 (-) Transcript_40867:330-674(-)
MADPAKALKIKTGVAKRYCKEYTSYGKEKQKQQARIDKLKSENADEADVRKQEEVLQETAMMIPDTRRKTEAALQELKGLLAEHESTDLASSKEFEEAKTVVKDIETTLDIKEG